MELKEYAAFTDQGPLLDLNEDLYDFDLDTQLYLVMDGFGGSGAGDQAVQDVRRDLRAMINNLAEDAEATMPFFFSPQYLIEGNGLVNAMIYAHNKLFQKNQELTLQRKAGASAVMALKVEDNLIVSSVGNCRAYLLRNGHLEKVFIEDSFRLISGNDNSHSISTIANTGFGVFPNLSYQMKELKIFPEDLLILMTDGIYGHLSVQDIAIELNKSKMSLRSHLEALVKLSNNRGNRDNQTGMILKF